jgi:hypothetical protein
MANSTAWNAKSCPQDDIRRQNREINPQMPVLQKIRSYKNNPAFLHSLGQ